MKYNQNGAMKRKGGLKGSFPSGNGGSLSTGLSSRASCDNSPASDGMDNYGPDQKPMAMPKTKARGPFTFA